MNEVELCVCVYLIGGDPGGGKLLNKLELFVEMYNIYIIYVCIICIL